MEDLRLPTKLMLLVALLQGLSLLLLHQSVDFEFWPATAPPWLFSIYAAVIIGPTLYLLAVSTQNGRQLLSYILPFTLLCSLLAFYTGTQTVPNESPRLAPLLVPMTFTLALLAFKALMYIQVKTASEPFNYPQLFHYSWRNLLTLGLAVAFTMVTWGVLMLWAGLFSVIKIDFFDELFQEKWFYYPALNLALVLGIIIVRRLSVIVDTIKQLQQALLKYLLVLLIFVALIFLISLPFTGLAPLWEKGPGSYLILWMQACILFALNSVYQGDADERPYGVLLHRFIYLGLLLLPCYSALVFYGLSLRIEQYGWSVSRYWGILAWIFLTLFSLGYAGCIVRLKDHWISGLGRINVGMGWLLMVALILINSPLLDLRKMTVNNQLARIASGESAPNDIDIHYLANQLARPGYDAIAQLKTTYKNSHPALVLKLNRAYQKAPIDAVQDKQLVTESIECLNACELPAELATQIYTDLSENNYKLMQAKAFYALAVDPNQDMVADYLLLLEMTYGFDTTLYINSKGGWLALHTEQIALKPDDTGRPLAERLGDLSINYSAPQFQHMQIGELQIGVSLRGEAKHAGERP